MALDPKQVIARNKALVVVYAIAIVPIPLWFVFVAGGVQGGARDSYKAAANTLRTKKSVLDGFAARIDKMRKSPNAPDPVFTQGYIDGLKEQAGKIEAQNTAMIDLVRAADKPLDKWFPQLSWDEKQGEPPSAAFESRFKEELRNMASGKDLGEFVTDPALRASLLWGEKETVGTNQRELQKKFWIQERVVKALKSGGAERLYSPVEFPPVAAPSGGTGPNAPPPKPTRAIPIKATALASFRDVPKILREVLAQDIVFKLVKIHTELHEFSVVNPKFGVRVNPEPKPLYESSVIQGTLPEGGTPPSDEEQVFPEPKIRVTLELEAVDFDMDVIAPPAATPPK